DEKTQDTRCRMQDAGSGRRPGRSADLQPRKLSGLRLGRSCGAHGATRPALGVRLAEMPGRSGLAGWTFAGAKVWAARQRRPAKFVGWRRTGILPPAGGQSQARCLPRGYLGSLERIWDDLGYLAFFGIKRQWGRGWRIADCGLSIAD